MDTFSKAKGMFDVVTGGNITGQTGALISKYQFNMITSGSILQVMPGQEAVFYKSGSSGFEILGPGEYPVDTKLIPFLQKVMNIPFGKKTPYTTHIWFVNKTTQFDFPWGTREKILLEDPKFEDVILKIGASGELRIEIIDTAVLFEKVVGTMREFTLEDLESTLKTTVIAKISGILQRFALQLRSEAKAMPEGEEVKSFIDLLGDNEDLAKLIKSDLHSVFEVYGIGVKGCSAKLTVDEEDENFKLVNSYNAELFAERKAARKRRIEAETSIDLEVQRRLRTEGAEIELRKAGGYTYQEMRQLDALNSFAENESGVGASAVGLGAGLGLMGTVAGQIQNTMQPQPGYQQPGYQQPPQPGYQQPGYQQPPQPGYQQPGYQPPPQPGYQAPPPQPVYEQPPQQAGVACPACGTVQGVTKFCGECGSPMEKKCPQCNVKVENAQKFCNECGTKLQ